MHGQAGHLPCLSCLVAAACTVLHTVNMLLFCLAGWQFDGQGQCTKMPQLTEGKRCDWWVNVDHKTWYGHCLLRA